MLTLHSPADGVGCYHLDLSQRHLAVHDDREHRGELQNLLVAQYALHPEPLPAAGDVHVVVVVCCNRLPAFRAFKRHSSDLREVSAQYKRPSMLTTKMFSSNRNMRISVIISMGLVVLSSIYSGYVGLGESFGFS